jgi:cytochrome b
MSNPIAPNASKASPTQATTQVWDLLVRLFHWSLVLSFAVAWVTAEEWDEVHEWAGYVAAGLVAFRLVWGLVGSHYARFSQFVRSPATIGRYLGALLRGTEQRYLGHNPAGGIMILVLLAAMIVTAVTGWMTTFEVYRHARWLSEIHETVANLMLVLIVIHVGGVVLASFRHHENLVRAMIFGRKRAPEPSDVT